MNQVARAIEKAVDGGWKPSKSFRKGWHYEHALGGIYVYATPRTIYNDFYHHSRVILDPLFWRGYFREKKDGASESAIRMAAEYSHLELVKHLHKGGNMEAYFAALNNEIEL